MSTAANNQPHTAEEIGAAADRVQAQMAELDTDSDEYNERLRELTQLNIDYGRAIRR